MSYRPSPTTFCPSFLFAPFPVSCFALRGFAFHVEGSKLSASPSHVENIIILPSPSSLFPFSRRARFSSASTFFCLRPLPRSQSPPRTSSLTYFPFYFSSMFFEAQELFPFFFPPNSDFSPPLPPSRINLYRASPPDASQNLPPASHD